MTEATTSQGATTASFSPSDNLSNPLLSNPYTTGTDIEEEENLLHRKLMVFGTDVGQIPCFRRSFLWGISGGMGLGVAHFAVTSRIPAATKFGFWSYVGITFSVWCYCRYDYTMTKQKYAQLQYAMKENAARQGTKDALQSTEADDN